MMCLTQPFHPREFILWVYSNKYTEIYVRGYLLLLIAINWSPNQRSPIEEIALKRKVQYFVVIAKNQVDLFVLMCEVLQDL